MKIYGLIADCGDCSSSLTFLKNLDLVNKLLEDDEVYYPNEGEPAVILNLPDDLLKEAGWKEGDVINWVDNHDGSWSLVKEDLTNFIQKGIIKNEQN